MDGFSNSRGEILDDAVEGMNQGSEGEEEDRDAKRPSSPHEDSSHMAPDQRRFVRHLPSVNLILRHPRLQELKGSMADGDILDAVRGVVDGLRVELLRGELPFPIPEGFMDGEGDNLRGRLLEVILERLEEGKWHTHKLRRVINATGIVLHTNLGRAILPRRTFETVADVALSYSNLEFDLEEGKRGSRHDHVGKLLADLTGAEWGIVVNNNAAAVFLVLNTLAEGKEVVISRGQLVEIGGSFRIPDIIARSGSIMVEVGTSNKTHPDDYESAISERTAVLLRVHRSNFKVSGFVEDVPLKVLCEIAQRHKSGGREGTSRPEGIVVVEDLGSGSLIDLARYGVGDEPAVRDVVAEGADIVTFSGDKLLGGPQAGIIVGRRALLERIARNPLARIVRIDKMTLAALDGLLRIYKDERRAVEEVPTLQMLTMGEETLAHRADELAARLRENLAQEWVIEVVDDPCEAGGGSLPGVVLPGKAVALRHPALEASEIQRRLRQWSTPIIGRVHGGRVLLNVRTLLDGDVDEICHGVASIEGSGAHRWTHGNCR